MGDSRDEEFTAYVQERRSHLLATAYLLCGDRHAAEDLVQTALAKLYVAWPRVRPTGSEDAYARQVLVNAGTDAHRRPEDRDELLTALAALTPGQRRVIVLRYWLGLSIEEVALDLEISTGAVERQTSDAVTGPDLLDRMTESTSWAWLEPIDPEADLRRGRLQLRRWLWRRRLALTAGTGLAVAATVAVTSVLTGPSAPQGPAFSAPPPIPTRPDRVDDGLREAERLASWFADHLDPLRRYIKATDSKGGGVYTGIEATMVWRQGTGYGQVALSVRPPGRYDIATGPATSTRCQVFGRKLADGPPYACRWTTKGGRRVLTGTADVSGVRSYFASYRRPDGYLVLAAVEGDRRGAFVRTPRPGGGEVVYPPVRDLAVSLDDVVATVTDPALIPPR